MAKRDAVKDFVNTVPADDQMIRSSTVSLFGSEMAGERLLVLGNSITRHGPKEDIGWPGDWGMAASAPEKDYVHLLYAALRDGGREVCMRVRQAASWERGFKEADCLASFAEEKAFGADAVIFRLGENVPKEDVPGFEEAILRLLSYLGEGRVQRLILTTCFWPHPERNRAIRAAAERLGGAFLDITCTDEGMMAIGKFEHSGVAGHPGDAGMKMIADRLFAALTE